MPELRGGAFQPGGAEADFSAVAKSPAIGVACETRSEAPLAAGCKIRRLIPAHRTLSGDCRRPRLTMSPAKLPMNLLKVSPFQPSIRLNYSLVNLTGVCYLFQRWASQVFRLAMRESSKEEQTMRNVDRRMTDKNRPAGYSNLAVRISLALFRCILLLPGVFSIAGAEASVMYVSNEDGRIFQVGATGIVTPFATLSANSISPSLAFDGNGTLYATEYVSNRISRINRDGQITPFATNIRSPDGLAFDQSGNLFTSTVLFGDVDKISPDGVVSTFATKMQLSGSGSLDYAPAGLAFGPDGNLYVAMSRNGKIMRIAPNGSVSLFVNLSPTILYRRNPSI